MEQIKSELVSLRLSGMAEALKTLQEGRKIHELTRLVRSLNHLK